MTAVNKKGIDLNLKEKNNVIHNYNHLYQMSQHNGNFTKILQFLLRKILKNCEILIKKGSGMKIHNVRETEVKNQTRLFFLNILFKVIKKNNKI